MGIKFRNGFSVIAQYAQDIKQITEMGVQVALSWEAEILPRHERSRHRHRTGARRLHGHAATVINGTALQSGLEKRAFTPVCKAPSKWNRSPNRISAAVRCVTWEKAVWFFGAGTGNPYLHHRYGWFSSCHWDQGWRDPEGTRVDGIYSADPEKDPKPNATIRSHTMNASVSNWKWWTWLHSPVAWKQPPDHRFWYEQARKPAERGNRRKGGYTRPVNIILALIVNRLFRGFFVTVVGDYFILTMPWQTGYIYFADLVPVSWQD